MIAVSQSTTAMHSQPQARLAWNAQQVAAAGGGAGCGGTAGGGGGGSLVGPTLTTADLAAWHYLCALERHYPSYYAPAMAGAPRLQAFKAAIAARPRIAAYLASERCPPWDEDSLM